MALTKIKLNTGMVTGSLPDANIPNDITISGAQTGITSVGTLATAHIQGGQAYASSATNLSTTVSKKALRVQGSSDASTSLWMGSLANDAQQYIQACNDAGNGADDIVLNPFGGKVGVGVGNASPAYPLDIVSTINNGASLAIRGDVDADGRFSGIQFGDNGSTSYSKGGIFYEGKDAYARGNLHFALEGGTGADNADLTDARMTITYDGKVGIQTSDTSGDLNLAGSFGAPLHILQKPSSQAYGLVVQGNSNANGARIGIAEADSNLSTRANTLEFGFDSSTDFIYSRTGKDMIIGVNSAERMRITSDGKFGFGGITPVQKYEFRGDNHNDILRMYDSANSDNIWILRNEVHSGTSSGRLQLLKGDGDGVELNGHDGRTSFIKSPLAIGGTTASEKLHIHDGDILVDSGRGVRANGGQEMIRFNSSNGVLINSGNAERIRFTRDGSIKHRDGIGAEMYKSGTTSSNGLAVSFDINLNSPSTLWTSVVVELLITTIGNSHPTASSLYLVEIEHHSTGGMTIATPVYIGGTGSQSISTSNPSTNVAQIRINGQGGSTSNVGAYCRVVSGVTGVSSIT